MKKFLALVLGLALLAWWLTRPDAFGPGDVPDHTPDVANGERLFHAAGCASCHSRFEGGQPDRSVMAGGLELESPIGTFVVPNISPDRDHGIGSWSPLDFINAMQRGVAPDGRHYYPAFPYTSYALMTHPDVLDVWAYLKTLPASDNAPGDHRLEFPFSLSRGLGLWKRIYLDDRPRVALSQSTPEVSRGQYLVEGPGHCGECHTPRNLAQAMDVSQWLTGAASTEGEGRVPGITPARSSFADWSEDDIAYYLEAGVDPEFDVVGGSMVAVQENLSRLPAQDREAIAAYLKALPAD